MTNKIQKHFKLSSTQLLYQSCPYQAVTLFIIGPFLDAALTKKNVFAFDYTSYILVSFPSCFHLDNFLVYVAWVLDSFLWFNIWGFLEYFLSPKWAQFSTSWMPGVVCVDDRCSLYCHVWFQFRSTLAPFWWLERHLQLHIKYWGIWRHAWFWPLDTLYSTILSVGAMYVGFSLHCLEWDFIVMPVFWKVSKRLRTTQLHLCR